MFPLSEIIWGAMPDAPGSLMALAPMVVSDSIEFLSQWGVLSGSLH